MPARAANPAWQIGERVLGSQIYRCDGRLRRDWQEHFQRIMQIRDLSEEPADVHQMQEETLQAAHVCL